MTVGFSDGGKCYATQAEAEDAHFSAQPVLVASMGYDAATGKAYTYIIRHVKTSTGWQEQHSFCTKPPGQTQNCATANQLSAQSVAQSCTMGEMGIPADFDYTVLGALFAFSFSVVAALYFIGKSGGSIINIFRPR